MKKRMIKLTGALLLVASLFFSGCGKSTQLDDYATNEGSDSVEEGTEAVADNTSGDTGGIPKDEIKVGVIHLSDPAEGSGYTYTHDLGIQGMQQNLNLSDDQIVRKINISDTDADTPYSQLDFPPFHRKNPSQRRASEKKVYNAPVLCYTTFRVVRRRVVCLTVFPPRGGASPVEHPVGSHILSGACHAPTMRRFLWESRLLSPCGTCRSKADRPRPCSPPALR